MSDLTRNLVAIADASRRDNGTDIPLGEQLRQAAARIEALEAENARLREALTPSGDTKAAYMGEFKFSDVVAHDNEGNPIYGNTYVPWTTIKEIMAAIQDRADLTGRARTEPPPRTTATPGGKR